MLEAPAAGAKRSDPGGGAFGRRPAIVVDHSQHLCRVRNLSLHLRQRRIGGPAACCNPLLSQPKRIVARQPGPFGSPRPNRHPKRVAVDVFLDRYRTGIVHHGLPLAKARWALDVASTSNMLRKLDRRCDPGHRDG
jgi:hypothetical protein